MEDLIFLLNSYVPQTPEILRDLAPLLKTRIFRRDEKILRLHQICRHVYFIRRGLIMIYKIVNGVIIPVWLLKEGDIFISIDSFFGQIPSDESIIALEETEVVGITYEEHEWMCQQHHGFLQLRDSIKTKYYMISNQRTADMTTLSAAERYEKLLKESPELAQRVSLEYLAGYLGMNVRTLNRIRSSQKLVRK